VRRFAQALNVLRRVKDVAKGSVSKYSKKWDTTISKERDVIESYHEVAVKSEVEYLFIYKKSRFVRIFVITD
jgi:hypothetical protein